MLPRLWPRSAQGLFSFVFFLLIGSPLLVQAQRLGMGVDSVDRNAQFNSQVLSSDAGRKPLSYEMEPASYSRIDGVPNSLSENYRKWEAVLDTPSFDIPEEQEIDAADLVKYLNDLGLPVVLDQSAIDDRLSRDTTINLPLRGSRLGDRLRVTLDEHNAAWAFDGNIIRIVSKDEANEAEHFMLVHYQISSLPTVYRDYYDVEPLLHTLTSAINPDEWNSTQGEQTICPFFVNGSVILVVNANYDTHQKIRQFFRSVAKFTHSSNGIVQPIGFSRAVHENPRFLYPNPRFVQANPIAFSGPSTAVAIPQRPRKAGINLPGSNSDNNGLFGGGGLGGGGGGLGGAFSVSNSIK